MSKDKWTYIGQLCPELRTSYVSSEKTKYIGILFMPSFTGFSSVRFEGGVPVRNKENFSSLGNDVAVNVSSSTNNAMCGTGTTEKSG